MNELHTTLKNEKIVTEEIAYEINGTKEIINFIFKYKVKKPGEFYIDKSLLEYKIEILTNGDCKTVMSGNLLKDKFSKCKMIPCDEDYNKYMPLIKKAVAEQAQDKNNGNSLKKIGWQFLQKELNKLNKIIDFSEKQKQLSKTKSEDKPTSPGAA